MPEESIDVTITSVGKPENEAVDIYGYKQTAKYKKLGWCKKRAINKRKDIQKMYAERLEKTSRALEMSEFLIDSRDADQRNDQDTRSSVEKIKNMQSALITRTTAVLKVGERMIREDSFGYPTFSQIRKRAMVNVRIANVLGMPWVSDRIIEMLTEVEVAYFQSDHYKKISTTASTKPA